MAKVNNSLPLSGIKVVELSTFVAISTATRMMADRGAEVVKIEPKEGDNYRFWGQNLSVSITDDENPLFSLCNMNKKLLGANLKTPEGMEIFLKLIKDADIFATNVRMKALAKMGISYEDLKKINPELIYVGFTGYGEKGALADKAGFDATAFWARGGIADWRDHNDFPIRPIHVFGDMTSSAYILEGVLSALIGKMKTGKGTYVEASLLNAAIWCGNTGVFCSQPPYNNPYASVNGKDHPPTPLSYYYETKDHEWIIFAMQNYDFGGFEKCCRTLGLDDFIGDDRYSTLAAVQIPENMAVMYQAVKDKVASMTVEEVTDLLTKNDIINEKLAHYGDIYKDEQAWENDMLRKLTFPSGTELAVPNPPAKLRGYGEREWRIPGSVGTDTVEILSGLGYSNEEIENMHKASAVYSPSGK